jgi:hypothetical protein
MWLQLTTAHSFAQAVRHQMFGGFSYARLFHKFPQVHPFHSPYNFAAIISKSITYGRKYGNGTGIAR